MLRGIRNLAVGLILGLYFHFVAIVLFAAFVLPHMPATFSVSLPDWANIFFYVLGVQIVNSHANRIVPAKKKKVFIICPVREITDQEKGFIANYVSRLEKDGYSVHWPPRDTAQDDPVGLRICRDNRLAIANADEVHVWWNGKSQGSFFDLGMAFATNKKIVLINFLGVPRTEGKSFNNLLLALSDEAAG
ncbi:MAG: hypothetical protein Q7S36_01110 [Candidatus Liptonbacteria bacterium]|nr:hypothetical protein [Candidatus Liptonbacteria bacterium]